MMQSDESVMQSVKHAPIETSIIQDEIVNNIDDRKASEFTIPDVQSGELETTSMSWIQLRILRLRNSFLRLLNQPVEDECDIEDSICGELDMREDIIRELGWSSTGDVPFISSSQTLGSPTSSRSRSNTPQPRFILLDNDAPSWNPKYAFSFPIRELPIKWGIRNNLTLENFTKVRILSNTPSSNAKIMLAMFEGEQVIIKMIKRERELNPDAIQEFDIEHGTLGRVCHPNVIRIKGSGFFPRKFIVLEYLSGGTLSTLVRKAAAQQRRFHRSNNQSFYCFYSPRAILPFEQVIKYAYDIAVALAYLHHGVKSGCSIIHRDLKGDNIGFTGKGALKLLDLGLCTTAKSNQDLNSIYEMTGMTGSLRYMAPEVALHKAYNSRVDVYSFAIVVWQMATLKLPFEGLSREEFIDQVVNKHVRPQLDPLWPEAFKTLLTKCWHPLAIERPGFYEVMNILNNIKASRNTRMMTASNEVTASNDSTVSRGIQMNKSFGELSDADFSESIHHRSGSPRIDGEASDIISQQIIQSLNSKA